MPTSTTVALSAAPLGWWDRLRVRQWWYFLALPLAGVDLHDASASLALSLIRGVLIAACVLSFGYLLNAVADRSMDLEAEKNPLLAEPPRSFEGLLLALALFALSLAATGPLIVLAATSVSLVSGWIYSTGPRLKAWPVIGTLLNVTNFAPLLLFGVSETPPRKELWLLVIIFSALIVQNQLLHEASDAEEDRGGHVQTTFLKLGPRGSAMLAFVAGVVVALASACFGGSASRVFLAAHLGLFAAAFPLWLALGGETPARMERARVAHRWCSVLSGGSILGALLWQVR
jgi:4-hydroxybenzoate polyprenyltransferase